MKGEPLTLRDVLEGSSYFEIPAYQRTYEWTLAEWRLLLADVVTQSGFSLHGAPPASRPSHFMGAILTEYEQGSARWSHHALVDGQQRMVTMSLLAAAIRHARDDAAGRDPTAQADKWFTLTRGGNLPATLRVVPQKSDASEFRQAVSGQWRQHLELKPSSMSAVWQAYAYFRLVLSLGEDAAPLILAETSGALSRFPTVAAKAFDANNIEGLWLQRLEAMELQQPGTGLPHGPRAPWDLDDLERSVLDRLYFFNLRRENGDEDTSVIFETINARGRGLFALDLVKNSIFMRLDDDPIRQRVFDKYWSPAEHILSKTRWSKKRAPFQEVFLYDYLIAAGEQQHQGSLSQSRGYNHFLRRVDRSVLPGRNYAQRLETFLVGEFFPTAAVWPVAVGATQDVSYDGTTRRVPDAAFERIKSLMAVSAGPPVPLVLVALVRWLRRDAGWQNAQLVDALTAIDSYVVRAAVCLTGISNLRSQFMAICGSLNGLDPANPVTVADLKRSLVGKKSDLEVEAAIEVNELYTKMKSDALLAVLRGLEAELTPAGGPHKIPADIYSVEHVYPQDSSKWLADLTRWNVTPKQRVALSQRLHLLGNLTAITRPHNSSLRNKAFAAKKAGIAQHAAGLKIHLNIVHPSTKRWTTKEIDSRTARLTKAFITHWP